MEIWVDADACPAVIKEILYRAAERVQVSMTLVANKPLHTPRSKFLRSIQVARGFDVADNEIAQRMTAGDLVITADIPLAADVIEAAGTHSTRAASSTRPTIFASAWRRAIFSRSCANRGC